LFFNTSFFKLLIVKIVQKLQKSASGGTSGYPNAVFAAQGTPFFGKSLTNHRIFVFLSVAGIKK